ncbi:MAG: hypothetical protein GY834_00900 [Bacteroidetes bacterium]|nr:hypothetical protein [Bacteroidota bacterium]
MNINDFTNLEYKEKTIIKVYVDSIDPAITAREKLTIDLNVIIKPRGGDSYCSEIDIYIYINEAPRRKRTDYHDGFYFISSQEAGNITHKILRLQNHFA